MAPIVGYHGTDAATASQILTAKGFDEPHQKGDVDWLGDGIYFFETYSDLVEGKREARDWVSFVKKESSPAILKAVIEPTHCLDMVSDIDDRQAYQAIKKELQRRWEQSGRQPRRFDDRTVFSAIRKRMKVDLIRCLVDAMPARDYDSMSHIVHRPQVQLCVTDRSCIRQVEYA